PPRAICRFVIRLAWRTPPVIGRCPAIHAKASQTDLLATNPGEANAAVADLPTLPRATCTRGAFALHAAGPPQLAQVRGSIATRHYFFIPRPLRYVRRGRVRPPGGSHAGPAA